MLDLQLAFCAKLRLRLPTFAQLEAALRKRLRAFLS
jgi:hypothetical protein